MNRIIIKGTTPTIVYTFDTVDVSTITAAYLTIKKGSDVVLERDLSTASAGEKTLSWTLTQAESLSVTASARIMCNWLLQDGTRGASEEMEVLFAENHKNEVI